MPKRTTASLDSDPSKLEDYIGACVKKLFKGYGEFKGHVSRVDRKAKDGMPIHIEYEDGDKGWMTFDEFSKIVVVDADGNLQYTEGKRKAKPAAESPAPLSKRSKKTPKFAGAGSSTGQPRGRSGVRTSGRSKPSQENVAHGKAAAAADGIASGAANGDVFESDTQPAVNGDTPTVDGDTPAAPGELPGESGELPAPDTAEAAAESQPESEAPDAHTTIDAATIQAAVAKAEPAAGNGHAPPPRGAERIAEPPAGETSELPKPQVKGIAKMLEHIHHNVHSQEDLPRHASTSGYLDATQSHLDIPPTSAASFMPASAPAVLNLVPKPPELPIGCVMPAYASMPLGPPTSPRPQQLAKYSQVVVHNGLVYISGQVPKDVMSRLGQTYYGQTQQVLHQLDELMLSVGVTKKRLLQVRIYLKNMATGREDFNRAWLEWVDQEALPARTMIEAKMVRESILVQIEATAALDSN